LLSLPTIPEKSLERATHPLPRPSARSTTEQVDYRNARATSFPFPQKHNLFHQNGLEGFAHAAAEPAFSNLHTYGICLRKSSEHGETGYPKPCLQPIISVNFSLDDSSARAIALFDRQPA
jgi:hypothetical protein